MERQQPIPHAAVSTMSIEQGANDGKVGVVLKETGAPIFLCTIVCHEEKR